MLSELFKPYGCTITRVGGNNATVCSYRIQCSIPQLDQSFSWVTSNNLEVCLKTRVGKLLAILNNGVSFSSSVVYDASKILNLIDTNYIILPPEAKLDSILEYISSLTSYDGQTIKLSSPKAIDVANMYFYNIREWRFYLDSAVSQAFVVKKTIHPEEPGPNTYEYGLSVKGLSRLIQVIEGKSSNICFVAMAFSGDMYAVAEQAIKPALIACNFKHYIVSDQHVDSDKTVNDAILAGIKKARFTIADFTHHRGGVYFEAGYALGRGQKVIYTCREDEMEKAHFDIRNYQHIVWKDAADFKAKLVNKIEAFIKE
jgi:hypothetical protein